MAERTVRDLLGLSIVSGNDVQLGDISEVYIDPVEQRVVKFSVDWVDDREHITGPDADLPLGQVMNFDPHQLVVATEIGETAGLDFAPYVTEDLIAASVMLDHEVVTRSGHWLGNLADIYFDESDGAITGYEVEQPESLLPSKLLAPTPDTEITSDRLIVPERLHFTSLAKEAELGREEEEQDLVFESGEADRSVEEPTFDLSLEETTSNPYLD
ncbi:MAG: PRC-barrel domain-containing protein [Cyanobacteria bacterium NC_groundwater_1444_Ag_S-0.65um_54_12]|nr:PRC-barrel domain-containing protein [Cyanobacteria bacterium NC_groundwater_1444_Ag_S-0.65um_54_12]